MSCVGELCLVEQLVQRFYFVWLRSLAWSVLCLLFSLEFDLAMCSSSLHSLASVCIAVLCCSAVSPFLLLAYVRSLPFPFACVCVWVRLCCNLIAMSGRQLISVRLGHSTELFHCIPFYAYCLCRIPALFCRLACSCRLSWVQLAVWLSLNFVVFSMVWLPMIWFWLVGFSMFITLVFGKVWLGCSNLAPLWWEARVV